MWYGSCNSLLPLNPTDWNFLQHIFLALASSLPFSIINKQDTWKKSNFDDTLSLTCIFFLEYLKPFFFQLIMAINLIIVIIFSNNSLVVISCFDFLIKQENQTFLYVLEYLVNQLIKLLLNHSLYILLDENINIFS